MAINQPLEVGERERTENRQLLLDNYEIIRQVHYLTINKAVTSWKEVLVS